MLPASPALNPAFRTHLRLVEASDDDAGFICGLRGDPELNKHLHASSPVVKEQLQWLTAYKAREAAGEEYYFVIVHEGRDAGVVRLYDFRELEGRRSFSWGSWIIPPPRVAGLVTFSALLVYQIGFEALGFEQAHFEVRKENVGVVAFHQRAGAREVHATDIDVFFRFFPEDHTAFHVASAEQIAQHRAPAAERL